MQKFLENTSPCPPGSWRKSKYYSQQDSQKEFSLDPEFSITEAPTPVIASTISQANRVLVF